MSSNVFKIRPKELLSKQFVDGQFVRWDTIIRCIAAKHYIETGKLHFLYIKDCELKHIYVNGSVSTFDVQSAIKNYIDIIESFIKFTYFSIANPVLVDRGFLLSDGTHRLAVSLAMDLEYMYYEIESHPNVVLDIEGVARLDWYKDRFTKEELQLMQVEYNRLI